MIANVALDYTEWAPPLSIERVRMDIDAYTARTDDYPSKIIMWVHQWDYLTKRFDHLKPKKYLWGDMHFIDDVNAEIRPPESSDGGTLWGIKVEVRDPENHAP